MPAAASVLRLITAWKASTEASDGVPAPPKAPGDLGRHGQVVRCDQHFVLDEVIGLFRRFCSGAGAPAASGCV